MRWKKLAPRRSRQGSVSTVAHPGRGMGESGDGRIHADRLFGPRRNAGNRWLGVVRANPRHDLGWDCCVFAPGLVAAAAIAPRSIHNGRAPRRASWLLGQRPPRRLRRLAAGICNGVDHLHCPRWRRSDRVLPAPKLEPTKPLNRQRGPETTPVPLSSVPGWPAV